MNCRDVTHISYCDLSVLFCFPATGCSYRGWRLCTRQRKH